MSRNSALGILEQCTAGCKEGEFIQLDPVTLRRIFLILARNHYATPEDNFGGVPDCFKLFKYSDDPKERTVEIELDYVFDNNNLLQEPAIYLGFSDFQFQRKVIDNYLDSTDDCAGQDYFSMAMTNCVIKHISSKPDEALQMGIVSSAFFRGLRSTLMKTLRFQFFEVEKLTAPTLMEPKGDDGDPTFQVNTVMRMIFQDTWTTNIESHRIKKVAFTTDLAESC